MSGVLSALFFLHTARFDRQQPKTNKRKEKIAKSHKNYPSLLPWQQKVGK